MDRRKLIGVFATEISSRVQINLYKELYEQAKSKGYNLVLFSGTYSNSDVNDTATITQNIFGFAEKMDFSAFVIHAQSIGNAELIDYVINIGRKKKIPVFLYDCETLGIKKPDGVITINPDYKQGFAHNVRHLIEVHDCKNIFMLAGIKDNKYSDDRIDMYRQEMEAHGLEIKEGMIGYGNFWEIPAAEAVNKFLDSDLDIPEAICCANDAMAITAVKTLRERGLKVPEDVLVTGFDGIEDGKYNTPSISTCEPGLDEVAKFVFDVIEGNDSSDEFLIPLRFIPKESCCGIYTDALNDRMELTRLMGNIRQNSWQNHMLATMQVSLIDCEDIPDSAGYMMGTLNFFNKYTHLFCLRDDIEYLSDYTVPFGKMRVHLNAGFLPADFSDSFNVEEVIPMREVVFGNAQQDDIFFIRIIHCADKMYGYYVVRTQDLISNEMKLLGQFCENFTNIIEAILRNRRLKLANNKLSEMYERMSEIYIRDTLTGMYNRHGYYQNLDEYTMREELKSGYVHIISIDMDGMKHINDNYGHLEGDNAIKAVAKAITDCFAQPCISARFGGDEFVVALFTESPEEPTDEKVSAKLNSYLKSIPMLEGKEYTVGVSIGKSVAKISDIDDFKSIEKIADDSMYENKRDRKSKVK